jgi:hypothetical protein
MEACCITGRRGLLRRSVLVAILSALALLGLYVGILTLANSLSHAVNQFIELWPWFSALILGFAIQAGLYAYTRMVQKLRHAAHMTSTKGITTTGGVSGAAMAACCAHHLSDVLPVIGLTGAALFFSEYQRIFLLLGILSNGVGITVMLHMMQKHGLMETGHPLFERISLRNMGRVFKWTVVLSVAVLTIVVTAKVYAQYF